jgi:hypothetical protein
MIIGVTVAQKRYRAHTVNESAKTHDLLAEKT